MIFSCNSNPVLFPALNGESLQCDFIATVAHRAGGFFLRIMSATVERFFDKIIRRDDGACCWEWTASTNELGYGRFNPGGGPVKAHRWIWEYVRGVKLIPQVKILHRCDNPKCVNPFHHRSGTIQDNVDDMVAKGRDFKSKGEDRPEAKLTDESVREIRRDYQPWKNSMRMLAKKYGVSHVVIKMVILRRSWKHVV